LRTISISITRPPPAGEVASDAYNTATRTTGALLNDA
jgi:hypothetical protein